MYGWAQVWDLRTQRELGSFRGHNRDVVTAAWHPQHEELFASGAMNGSLLYWLVSRPGPQVCALAAVPVWLLLVSWLSAIQHPVLLGARALGVIGLVSKQLRAGTCLTRSGTASECELETYP